MRFMVLDTILLYWEGEQLLWNNQLKGEIVKLL